MNDQFAMQSDGNDHKNIEYNVFQWESIGKPVKYLIWLILQYVFETYYFKNYNDSNNETHDINR